MEDEELSSWVQKQDRIAFKRILDNIGTGQGEVTSGAVIASPSRTDPNYFYQWVRDAAITIDSVVQYIDDHSFNDTEWPLSTVVESYIWNSYTLQRLDNPSGDFESLSGLGEPKFMPDSTPFKGSWGRPQRDGPALRTITISNYLAVLDKYGMGPSHPNLTDTEFIYANIVKPDLQYIVKYWASSGFDLWEEVDSMHLFTSLTQLKALKMGVDLACKLKDYSFNAQLVATFNELRLFVAMNGGFTAVKVPFLIETPALVVQGKRCGLDIGSILGVLHSHDVDDASDTASIPFPVSDSMVMNTLTALVGDMEYRYPVNHRRLGTSSGVSLGRYPEDIYDGYGTSQGNPWFISTATAAEVLYKIVYQLFMYEKDLVLTPDQSKAYSKITTLEASNHTYVLPYGSDAFKVASQSLQAYADSFMDVIKEHVDAGGHMSEQINRYTGFMEGAEDLTWSYGAFWSASRWRKRTSTLLALYT